LRVAAQATQQSTDQGEVFNFESLGHIFNQLTEKYWGWDGPRMAKAN